MVPTPDIPVTQDIITEEPYSILLGIKEISLLSIIFFFGFCGFSLCAQIIDAGTISNQNIDNIEMYDIPVSTITYNEDGDMGITMEPSMR